jgi:dienelactone hydrolase
MNCRSSLALCLASLSVLPAQAQRVDFLPSAEVVVGRQLQISVSGLPPGTEQTLITRRVVSDFMGGKRLVEAQATFRSDANGRIDLASAVPLAGSYQEADVQGLFWSARAVAAPPPADLGDDQVEFDVRQGERELTRARLTLHRSDPALQWQPVPGLPGAALASLPGGHKLPAIIALGGSEGGSVAVRGVAARLASQGYAVLAFPYYSPSGWGPSGPMPAELPALPSSFIDIPVDRLEQARGWLLQQPGVDGTRIALYGVSKGAEFALIAASRMPWVSAVVAVVPSDVVWEGWGMGVAPGQRSSYSWQGNALPFVPYRGIESEFAGFQTGAEVRLRRPHDGGRADHPAAVEPARIRVEDIAGPVLVIGGGDDQVWDSGGMASAIAARRAAAGRPTEALIYPQAGHAIGGPGWSPTTGHNAGPMKLGGQPDADARAAADAWPKTLAFLRRALTD